jgi:hypothetical protein
VSNEVEQLLEQACGLAVQYYRLTGKPLGITGEIGEFLAAKYLRLQLLDARSPGFDAVDADGRRIQIKARSIPGSKTLSGQRVGSIRLTHDWDDVVLVMMNEHFEPLSMYRAERSAIEQALTRPGSRARNERGAMAVVQFMKIGRKVWPPAD